MEREWGSAAVVALAHLVTDQCTGGCTAHGAQRAAEQGIPHDTTGHGAYAGTDLCTAGIGGTAGREQGNGCCGGNGIKAGLPRSGEGRGGEEGRSRWAAYHL